jgi:DNA-binding NtrC family response regulator
MAEDQVVQEVQIEPLADHQRKYIAAVLRQLEGNRIAAAKALGISLRGLQYTIARWRRDGHDVPESQHSMARNLPWANGRKPPGSGQGRR